MSQGVFTHTDGTRWAAELASTTEVGGVRRYHLRFTPLPEGPYRYAASDRPPTKLTDEELRALLAAALERDTRAGGR